ncbi:hypothetical protein QSE00_17345 [Arenibacter sp. M-2]|uniref:hypothetical protein n=1 Tax=Arenibacter sp. M-2 TaxID=3053612 RepID=UPI0025706968|nr:hypothetical protein [Arenibacter sp. M-2]MDL5513589.1 hypothetical protein [Arenibacter sp. M-2]
MEKIYWAWFTAEGITSWFLSKATYISPDGRTKTAQEMIAEGDSYIREWHNKWPTKPSLRGI